MRPTPDHARVGRWLVKEVDLVDTPSHSDSNARAKPALDRGECRTHQVRMEFPAVSENIGFARASVAMFASRLDFTLDELDEIKVAVSEAVSNCVLHAYPGRTGWVSICLAVDEGRLHVWVSDDGIGIANLAEVREAGVTSRPDDCMGLGFTFMAEYMDQLEVDSSPGRGTRVSMNKRPSIPPDAERRKQQSDALHESGEGPEVEGARGDAAG